MCSNLLHIKPPKPNLSKEEYKALDLLATDDNIVIIPADKGRCVVLLDKPKYVSKCEDRLKDKKTYKKVGANPTSGFHKKVTKALEDVENNSKIGKSTKWKLTPPTEPAVPAFYGLPNFHKPEPIPVRPIVSSIGSATYNIARHIAWLLKPLVGRMEHHVKNIH